MNVFLQYLEESKESLSSFAIRIGRSPSTLFRSLSGARNPSIGLARDVERGTCGVVSATAFIAICVGQDVPGFQQHTAGAASQAAGGAGPAADRDMAGPADIREAAE